MNSFNHYAFGAVGDWLHRSVGGLAPAAPGYRRLRIAPVVSRIDGAPTAAGARHLTPYGPAESSWHLDGTTFELTAVVPPNTTATIVLPGDENAPLDVASGTHTWRYDLPRTAADEAAGRDRTARPPHPGACHVVRRTRAPPPAVPATAGGEAVRCEPAGGSRRIKQGGRTWSASCRPADRAGHR